MYKLKKKIREIINNVLGIFKLEIRNIENVRYIKILDIPNFNWDYQKNYFNQNSSKAVGEKLTFNWLIPHIGPGGGGHTVIFRFIKYLNEQGHKNRIYIIDNYDPKPQPFIKEYINEHYFDIGATEIYRGSLSMKDSDVNVATSWETAYYSYNVDNTKLKSYLILDFEPYFYSMGMEYLLAEKTYEMGFFGLGGGKWIFEKVIKSYNLEGMYFNLGVDLNVYKKLPNIQKDPDKVVVYFRSWSPRRGAELLVPALKLLKEKRPNTKIVLIGEKIHFDLPFEYESIGVTTNERLTEIYNSAAITLVFSLTNYSLLPQDAMACGSLVMELDTPANREVYDVDKHNHMVLVKPDPNSVSENIIKYLEDKKLSETIINNGLNYIKEFTWDKSFKKVEDAIFDQFKK